MPGGGVEGLAYSSDGRTLYTLDTGGRVTAWGVATHKGEQRFQLRPNERDAAGMQVAGGGRYFVFQPNRKLVVWDSETGEARRPRLPAGWGGFFPDPTAPRVWHLASDQREAGSWDLARYEPGPAVSGWPDDLRPTRLGVGPDGTFALIGTRQRLVLFHQPTATVLGDFPLDANYLYPEFSPDGGLLVFTGGGRVQVWDVRSRAVRLPSLDGTMAVGRLALHPTAPLMLTQGADHAPTLFSLETGAAVRVFDIRLGNHVNCLAFAPDGLTCAVGGSSKQFAVFDVDL